VLLMAQADAPNSRINGLVSRAMVAAHRAWEPTGTICIMAADSVAVLKGDAGIMTARHDSVMALHRQHRASGRHWCQPLVRPLPRGATTQPLALPDATHGKGPLNRAVAAHLGTTRLWLHAQTPGITHPASGARLLLQAAPGPQWQWLLQAEPQPGAQAGVRA